MVAIIVIMKRRGVQENDSNRMDSIKVIRWSSIIGTKSNYRLVWRWSLHTYYEAFISSNEIPLITNRTICNIGAARIGMMIPFPRVFVPTNFLLRSLVYCILQLYNDRTSFHENTPNKQRNVSTMHIPANNWLFVTSDIYQHSWSNLDVRNSWSRNHQAF